MAEIRWRFCVAAVRQRRCAVLPASRALAAAAGFRAIVASSYGAALVFAADVVALRRAPPGAACPVASIAAVLREPARLLSAPAAGGQSKLARAAAAL